MKKAVIVTLLCINASASLAALNVDLDGNRLFTTNPEVTFNTSINLLTVQSNENLTCNGGSSVTPDSSILSLEIDGATPLELQGDIAIDRTGDDTTIVITSINGPVVCSFIDEILVDGFEAPILKDS